MLRLCYRAFLKEHIKHLFLFQEELFFFSSSNDTKDRILEAALEIFSRDGYAGADLKDIAGAVGVVKSGFYRHYASKDEIWNAVLDEMERYYAERFGSSENLPAIPQSTDELKTAKPKGVPHESIFGGRIQCGAGYVSVRRKVGIS